MKPHHENREANPCPAGVISIPHMTPLIELISLKPPTAPLSPGSRATSSAVIIGYFPEVTTLAAYSSVLGQLFSAP